MIFVVVRKQLEGFPEDLQQLSIFDGPHSVSSNNGLAPGKPRMYLLRYYNNYYRALENLLYLAIGKRKIHQMVAVVFIMAAVVFILSLGEI